MTQEIKANTRPIEIDGVLYPDFKSAAEKLGVSRQTLWSWYKGKTKPHPLRKITEVKKVK